MAATKTSNFFTVNNYRNSFETGREYEFTYNGKLRIVRVEQICVPIHYQEGKCESYIHCVDLINGGFRNFTIVKIDGEVIAR
jgi:D-lyxose ketol-isomerase